MKVITIPLGPVGLCAILYLGVLFANFSRRLGAVTKMPPLYRWFGVANVFIALAVASQLVRGIAAIAPDFVIFSLPWFPLLTFHIPLAIGVTLDLALVWHYWHWIFKEKIE